MGVTLEESAARLQAAREAAPDAWLGTDLVWMFQTVDAAAAYAETVSDLNLGCIEDIFPPGNAGKLAELRKRVKMPIWQGDEQGGSYYPEALILAKSVDLVRVDLTCMGGITGGRGDHRRMPRRRRQLRPAHVRACAQPGVQRLGLRRQADRMGRAVDRRRPLCRQPRATRVMTDGLMRPLHAGAGLRQHAQPRVGAEPAA